ncbi:MAG: hypothetical protein FJX76_05650 [Armatimonadetes bacterium]|nr:hypothetical protein [Armatimonadota bacterium]
MTEPSQDRRDILAQWAFDTRPILGRFHLWLDDVEMEWARGKPTPEDPRPMSFVDGRIERLLAMTAAATAVGTQAYGRFGGAAGLDKAGMNQIKKDADAISAYAMSESLWYLTRQLPENHAIMVCLGEGLMPKAGETPEMGSNPQLGFGRVYARPEVARWLDDRVARLLNDPRYSWDDFYGEIKRSGITVWGAAIDTLENTSRFALGKDTGPMTILHLFNQPLHVLRPYEGYAGNLFLPNEVVEAAADRAILINYRTPREKVLEAIETAYPGIQRKHIHVWTLSGKSRANRIGKLWKIWTDLGVHLVEEGWTLPSGLKSFNDSGTYAPTFTVGTWNDDDGHKHVFLCDGYAASAEAVQAASLARILGLDASLSIFTSRFDLPYDRETSVMHLDPSATDFVERLKRLSDGACAEESAADYRRMIRDGRDAGIDLRKPTLTVDDFLPEKRWEVLAVIGYMCDDPYTGAPGVQNLGNDRWRVTVRLVSERGDKNINFTLRLMETHEQGRLVFTPLLNRFLSGEDYQNRAVKISDSGRIRNELQTLCAEALEFPGEEHIRIHFDRIEPTVIALDKQAALLEILRWYSTRHPLWFSWLEIVPPGQSRVSNPQEVC